MILNNYKIGIIGLGNMGTAIMKGLHQKMPTDNLYGFDINPNRCTELKSELQINYCHKLTELVTQTDITILAIKPNVLEKVLLEIQNNSNYKEEHFFLSIVAGAQIQKMETILGKKAKIARIMPNTPALVNEGMSVISVNKNITKEETQLIEQIFLQIGKTLILPENQLDAVTGVSGCGPAYAYTMIQAMADGGVRMGLPRQEAEILAAQTLLGSAQMILQNNENPINLRNKVTSPGGSTIIGVQVLEENGFSGIIMKAVEKATIKTRELGE